LLRDLVVLQPTIMCGVPRVFNRLFEQIQCTIEQATPVWKWFTNWGMRVKHEALLYGDGYSLILDWLLFSKCRELLGGRIRLIVSGGAPLLPEVFEGLRIMITPNIIQGHGETEISAAGCVQGVGDASPMTVGPVCISTDVKFRRVQGLNYDPRGKHPSGELMFRGPTLFKGYYKEDPAPTIEDGWFPSGDIACLTSDGQVQIVDRVKQFLKLSQGEYVSLVTLSKYYSQTPGLRYCWVFADSHHSQPVAVVIPTENAIEDWRGRRIIDIEKSALVKGEILENIRERAEQLRLRSCERILDIIVDQRVFTVENGLLTASMELHVAALRAKYEAELLELYADHR
jgi:long-chain acyl-CoA synthetase